jgi:hypothetical protein
MLGDAEAKLFDVLLVDDFSRLSRDKRESEQTRRAWCFMESGSHRAVDVCQHEALTRSNDWMKASHELLLPIIGFSNHSPFLTARHAQSVIC